MYNETLKSIADAAQAKASLSKQSILAQLIHSGMGGVYIGFGMILIVAVATPLAAANVPGTSLILGACFGLAMSLVICAGSDLFTGNTLIMPTGALHGTISWEDVFRILALSFLGNLLGSVLLAFVVYQAGIFQADPSWIIATATKKMQTPGKILFYQAILSNWLVVLATWCAFRMKSESGRLIMIWWCLLGFAGFGFEHSIPNMTLLTLANLLPHGPAVSWKGMVNNLIPVTIGNVVSGTVFTAFAYGFIGRKESLGLMVQRPQAPMPVPQTKVGPAPVQVASETAPPLEKVRTGSGLNQVPTALNQAPTASNQVPTASNQAPAASNQAPAASNQAPAASNQAPAALNQLLRQAQSVHQTLSPSSAPAQNQTQTQTQTQTQQILVSQGQQVPFQQQAQQQASPAPSPALSQTQTQTPQQETQFGKESTVLNPKRAS